MGGEEEGRVTNSPMKDKLNAQGPAYSRLEDSVLNVRSITLLQQKAQALATEVLERKKAQYALQPRTVLIRFEYAFYVGISNSCLWSDGGSRRLSRWQPVERMRLVPVPTGVIADAFYAKGQRSSKTLLVAFASVVQQDFAKIYRTPFRTDRP
jgi:hypothetical protein